MGVWVWVCTCTCTGREQETGTFHDKDLIPVSLVGIFSMNVRFFSLLMSLRIKKKKTVIYRRPCPAFYFCGQNFLTSKNRGPEDKEIHTLRLRTRVTAFLPAL